MAEIVIKNNAYMWFKEPLERLEYLKHSKAWQQGVVAGLFKLSVENYIKGLFISYSLHFDVDFNPYKQDLDISKIYVSRRMYDKFFKDIVGKYQDMFPQPKEFEDNDILFIIPEDAIKNKRRGWWLNIVDTLPRHVPSI